ncbi:MAG: hypothetical protein CMM50_15805 [Rhodospirillaceae bacterium]|nr:hypothetical protein [Rhodospirillaceae bacterium]
MTAMALESASSWAAALPRTYSVDDVAVDETADSAESARQIALAEGQRKALRQLFERLTFAEDYDRLPPADDSAVTYLVRSFQVKEERVSPTRYRAKLAVDFNASAVRNMLEEAGIPFVAQVPESVLVLPVYRDAAGIRLWEDPNPWRQAWSSRSIPDGLVPFQVPLGDLEDLLAIDAQKAASMDEAALKAIGDRYGTPNVLVAIVEADQSMPSPDQPATVSVDMKATGDLVLIGELALPGIRGESVDAAMADAADAVVVDVREEWKNASLLIGTEQTVLTADAEISGLDDYLALRQQVVGVPLVRQVAVEALTVSTARLAISHVGTADQLAAAMSRQDLQLNGLGGVYFLRRAPAVDEAPAPMWEMTGPDEAPTTNEDPLGVPVQSQE